MTGVGVVALAVMLGVGVSDGDGDGDGEAAFRLGRGVLVTAAEGVGLWSRGGRFTPDGGIRLVDRLGVALPKLNVLFCAAEDCTPGNMAGGGGVYPSSGTTGVASVIHWLNIYFNLYLKNMPVFTLHHGW